MSIKCLDAYSKVVDPWYLIVELLNLSVWAALSSSLQAFELVPYPDLYEVVLTNGMWPYLFRLVTSLAALFLRVESPLR